MKAAAVIAKIRGWEKAARVSEELAVQRAGAITARAEAMRDPVELLMRGLEMQNDAVGRIATVRDEDMRTRKTLKGVVWI